MARYIGPKIKISKRFNEPILNQNKPLKKKNSGGGQWSGKRKRRKSEYAIQLDEKQKAKYLYGVLEKQFANTFNKASRKKGIKGELLLQMLEARLDNIVYRFGIAPTRRAARQLVLHKHILVNGKIVNIPSYALRLEDKVEVREKSKSLEAITLSLAAGVEKKYKWLEWDTQSMTGKVLSVPSREEIPENINEQLIVELYSK